MAPASFPASSSELTIAWLNEVLADRFGPIASVTVESLGTGPVLRGDVVRIHLSGEVDPCDGPLQGGGFHHVADTGELRPPSSIVGKWPSASPVHRRTAQALGAYQREVCFYRDLSRAAGVRTPEALAVQADPSGLPFALLLEDVTGARCADSRTGITAREAAAIVDTVAGLHARFWERDDLESLAWLPAMSGARYRAVQAAARKRWPAFLAHYGAHLAAEVITAVSTAIAHDGAVVPRRGEHGPLTFTHTDCRSENYLLGGSAGPDAVTMIDFQLCARNVGAWDVAALLASSMASDARRMHDGALVARYHDRLTAAGIAGYSLDRCWRDLRACWLEQCVAAVAASDLDTGAIDDLPRSQRNDLAEHAVLRAFHALDDHGAGDLTAELAID